MDTAESLVRFFSEHRLTCATAESCTGGGVGHAITAVPGSSAVFNGGIISYSNEIKQRLLGVSVQVLSDFGAVSPECATAMAIGARERLAADFAVSITGIAGPGGGSAEKPVGLVCFAVSSKSGVVTDRRVFPGDRAAVRSAAIGHALRLLISAAENSL
jgi:PncC family amidohydrolase